jgi:hypothetical protein
MCLETTIPLPGLHPTHPFILVTTPHSLAHFPLNTPHMIEHLRHAIDRNIAFHLGPPYTHPTFITGSELGCKTRAFIIRVAWQNISKLEVRALT